MADYRVTFDMSNGRMFSREVSAENEVDASFIGTLDLVHAIEEQDRWDLLEDSNWATTQALALQVTRVTVKAV